MQSARWNENKNPLTLALECLYFIFSNYGRRILLLIFLVAWLLNPASWSLYAMGLVATGKDC